MSVLAGPVIPMLIARTHLVLSYVDVIGDTQQMELFAKV
jgi:hypothetical protein